MLSPYDGGCSSHAVARTPTLTPLEAGKHVLCEVTGGNHG